MIEPRIKIPKITNEARQRIRNNSVAKLPANASESGLSAIALQELFVAPIIGEQNSIITEYNAAIGEVNIVLNAFDGVVSKSSEDSAKAITDSCAALVAASNAEESALKSAKDSAAAGLAAKQAEDNSIAADTNSKAALENSITAKQNAKTALDTANGIDAKATTALGNSIAALDKSVTAENTANTVRSEFDQIVEGKIGISQDILSTDPLTAPSSEAVRNALDDLTQVITPTNQQSEVVHLDGTSAGFVDELIMSSEPTQVVSPNLIKQPYIQSSLTTQGITFTVNADFSIKVSGMPTDFATFHLCQLTLPIGTYCSSGTVYNGVSIIYQNVEPQSGEPPYLNFSAITLTRATLINIYLQVNPTYTPNNVSVYPMLNVGSTALPYQPYTGQPSPDNPIPINVVSSPVNIVSCEANLLPNTLQTKTQSGVMFTVNADKSITVNGTATARIVLYITEPKHQPFYFAKGTNFVLSTKELSQSGVAFEILVTSTENKYSYFAVGDYRYVHGFTLPNNGKTIGSYIVIDSGITVDNYTFYPMLNIGTNDLPYEPYNAVTTQIPLETVATETTPSKTVELLGEYNTETNVLAQEWAKAVFDGSDDERWVAQSTMQEGKYTVLTSYLRKSINIPNLTSIISTIKCNYYKTISANSTYSLYSGCSVDSVGDFIIYNENFNGGVSSIPAFKAYLAANPLTVYYELAAPEILTLNPAPPITTLEGTTNIYTVNNASPVTFNITELLDGGNQTNVVLKDKDDNVLNPRTVAQQVRINDDGETLDRELERIQAAISGVDSDLSAEISARTAADTQIRGDIAKVDSDLQSEKLARAAANTYDVVIRTQEQFDELYNSATWLDAKSVAFIGDGGVLKFTRTGQGLKIPSTVTTIVGYNWATIRINKFEYDEVNNLAALYYESFNYMSSIQDIKVECDSYFHNKKNSVCFYRCSNMRRCIGYCETSGGLQGITVSFLDCDNLNGCIGTIESDVTEKTKGAFVNCSCLYDCKGGTTYGAIFDNCKNIANCRDIRTRATFGIVFLNCQQISNCIVKGTDTGFNKCSNLTNCTADAGDHSVDAFGFLSCANLTNCKASGVASRGVGGRGYGFYNVSYCSCCGASDIVSTSAIAGGTNTKIDSNTCDFTNS